MTFGEKSERAGRGIIEFRKSTKQEIHVSCDIITQFMGQERIPIDLGYPL